MIQSPHHDGSHPQRIAPEQVKHCRHVFDTAHWEDGRTTAGHQSTQVKKNLQLPEHSPQARELGDLVLRGLERSPLFISAVLPQRVFPPLFNRYDAQMNFGSHVDNAIRPIPGTRCACAPMSPPPSSCPSWRRMTAASSSWRTPTAATR